MHDTKYLVCSFLSVGMLCCFHFLGLLGWMDLTPVAVQEAQIEKKTVPSWVQSCQTDTTL
jgi:hypothetical protein